MRLTWVVAAVAFAFAVSTTGAFAAAKIVVEGESYAKITSSMAVKTDTKASGGKCVQIPLRRPHATSETGPGDSGYAEYKIKVTRAGTYQMWGRVWWYDSCGNSFFVLLDSTTVDSKTPYITDQTYQKWHWVAGPRLTLSEGQHTIRIQNREDGTQMDQWLLTTTPKNRGEPTRIEKETKQYIIK